MSVAQCLTTGTGQRYDAETETLIPTHGGGFDEVIGFDAYNNDITGNVSKTIDTGQDYHHVPNIFTFAHQQGGSIDIRTDNNRALTLQSSQTQAVHMASSAVRRLTPRECERLQGFPDDYTLVPHRNKPMSDGPRYKALGNSMAVPVMRWIGERIAMVDALL